MGHVCFVDPSEGFSAATAVSGSTGGPPMRCTGSIGRWNEVFHDDSRELWELRDSGE